MRRTTPNEGAVFFWGHQAGAASAWHLACTARRTRFSLGACRLPSCLEIAHGKPKAHASELRAAHAHSQISHADAHMTRALAGRTVQSPLPNTPPTSLRPVSLFAI